EISHFLRRRFSKPSPFQNPQEKRAHFAMSVGGVWAQSSKPSAKPACPDGARCALRARALPVSVDFERKDAPSGTARELATRLARVVSIKAALDHETISRRCGSESRPRDLNR